MALLFAKAGRWLVPRLQRALAEPIRSGNPEQHSLKIIFERFREERQAENGRLP